MNGSDPVAGSSMMKLSEAARALPGRMIGPDVEFTGVTTGGKTTVPGGTVTG